MKVWPDADGTLVRRYLRTLGLRNSDSPRCVLNNFQRFVAGRVDDKPLRVSTVESWVRERTSEWSLRTLVAGAQSVNRFLNWLVADNVLTGNPWFDLCQQYGQRTAPVVRAILRPDTAQALEALRPLPPFGSHLGQAMWQHLKRMRSLGFRYEREASRLLAFDRYLQQRTGASAQPLSCASLAIDDNGICFSVACDVCEHGAFVAVIWSVGPVLVRLGACPKVTPGRTADCDSVVIDEDAVAIPVDIGKEGTAATAQLSRENCRHRPVQYLNNILEQDHRAIKRRVRASQHFRSFWGAWRTISGYEAIHMIRKGQACWIAADAKVGLLQRFILFAAAN
jgi:DDE domain